MIKGQRPFLALLIYLFSGMFFMVPLRGQTTASAAGSSLLTSDTDDQAWFVVRPLDELIEAAVRYSPLLRSKALKVENLSDEIKLERRSWADYVTFNGTYQYGGGDFLDAIETIYATDYRLINRQNAFYSVGVAVKIPMSQAIGKGPKVHILRNEMERQKLEGQQTELEIRQAVINQYQDLQLSIKAMEIKTRNLEFHRASAQLAEKYFREGNMDLDKYTQTVAQRNQAELELEEAKAQAQLSYLMLRELVGMPISSDRSVQVNDLSSNEETKN